MNGIGHARPFVFCVEWFDTHSPLSLIGVYVAARCFRLMGIENKLPSKWLLVMLVASIPLAMVGLAHYNSPIAFAMVAALFLLFKRHVKVGTWVMAIAPSMFSVYMLHCTKAGLVLMTRIEDMLMAKGLNVFVMFAVVSLLVFVICVLLDAIRRIVMRLWPRD